MGLCTGRVVPRGTARRGCDPWRVPDAVLGIGLVLVIAAVALAIGVGFGIVIAPRLGRLFERLDRDDDEEPGDRAD